jgi:opacity protein-like surface antigen
LTLAAQAQTPSENSYYARVNTFGVFGAYSGDSSHILMGDAESRRLLNLGVSYSRRLFLNRDMNWQYDAELSPVAIESDPESRYVLHQTAPTIATYYSGNFGPIVSCKEPTIPYSYVINGVTYSGTQTLTCYQRRWTMGEAISPAGLQWNFLPLNKAQPFFVLHGGYMYSTRAIPTSDAGSFNFTLDFGAGIELYRSKTRSIRAEYRYHHISNKDTSRANPGIDNGLFQATYSFGN